VFLPSYCELESYHCFNLANSEGLVKQEMLPVVSIDGKSQSSQTTLSNVVLAMISYLKGIGEIRNLKIFMKKV